MNAHVMQKSEAGPSVRWSHAPAMLDVIADLAASQSAVPGEVRFPGAYRRKKEDNVDPVDAEASGFAGAGCGAAGAGGGSSRFERFEE